MPRKQPPKGLLTATDAARRLNISVSMLYNHVRAGRLERIIPEGRTQGFFREDQINDLKNGMYAFFENSQDGYSFRQATLETQEDEFRLAELTFGEKSSRFHDNRRELLLKNPDLAYYFYVNGTIVASIDITPLDDDGIAMFKDGERGWLLVDHVYPLAPGKMRLIIIDLLTTPLVPRDKRAAYALLLIRNMTLLLASWANRGIEIESIHACGGTPEGIRMLEHAGFVFLGEPRAGRRIYELDVATSPIRELDAYKASLAEYKRQH